MILNLLTDVFGHEGGMLWGVIMDQLSAFLKAA